MPAATSCKTKGGKYRETCGASDAPKTKHACVVEADESTRNRLEGTLHKDHEDHVGGKGINSLNHYNLVHKFIPMPQAMKIPDAKKNDRARRLACCRNEPGSEFSREQGHLPQKIPKSSSTTTRSGRTTSTYLVLTFHTPKKSTRICDNNSNAIQKTTWKTLIVNYVDIGECL